MHGTPDYTDNSDYHFINGNNLVDGRIEIYENTKKVSTSTFFKNNKDLKENTLLISINGTIGSIAKYNNEKVMLGKSVGYFNFNNNSDFIYFTLHTKSIQDYFFSELTGSTIKNLSLKTLRETNIHLPSSEEQIKISYFLSLIDNRIQTQRKIIEQLETLMKASRENVFSQKLRFRDNEENDFPNWNNMVLGNIGDVKMCRRVFNDQTSSNGDIPFYKIGSFGKVADAFISKKLYKEYRKRFSFPKKGDILISAAGTIGRTVVYRGEDAYYQDSNIVWIDNDNTKVLNEFLYFILQIVQYSTEGGTIQRLYNNILKSTKFHCPSLLEQEKIVNFLSSIQKKIENEKQFLEKLELQKKFLLDNLFI